MTTETEITEEQPKFEMRGFNGEMITDEPAVAETQELTPEQADAIMGGAAPETAVTEPEATAVAAKTEPKIKIGDKEFANTDEAWTYAQELQREKDVSDAFRHGIETAQTNLAGNLPKAPQPEIKKLDFTTDFYSDPEGYFARREAEVLAKAEAKIAEREQAALQAKKNDETWSEFYKEYPDLDKSRLLVRAVLDKEWVALEKVETKKALKIIAEKARTEKQIMFGEAAPGTLLPKVKTIASPGGATEVTRTQPEGKTLSFVEQMKQNNRKKSVRGMRR